MRLLIAAGGTGGHIYPALAVARSLSTGPEPPDEIRNIPNDRALQRSFFEHGAGDGRIATLRGKDERLFR